MGPDLRAISQHAGTAFNAQGHQVLGGMPEVHGRPGVLCTSLGGAQSTAPPRCTGASTRLGDAMALTRRCAEHGLTSDSGLDARVVGLAGAQQSCRLGQCLLARDMAPGTGLKPCKSLCWIACMLWGALQPQCCPASTHVDGTSLFAAIIDLHYR